MYYYWVIDTYCQKWVIFKLLKFSTPFSCRQSFKLKLWTLVTEVSYLKMICERLTLAVVNVTLNCQHAFLEQDQHVPDSCCTLTNNDPENPLPKNKTRCWDDVKANKQESDYVKTQVIYFSCSLYKALVLKYNWHGSTFKTDHMIWLS